MMLCRPTLLTSMSTRPCSFCSPKKRDADKTKVGGWGLYLVDQLADRWGVNRGKLTRVWFEIDYAEGTNGNRPPDAPCDPV